MAFTPQALLQILGQYPDCQRYLIAYSGGADSHVLLHALSHVRTSLNAEVLALHVDHQLQAQSAQWAQHCVATCVALDIPCQVMPVEVALDSGKGLEAAARKARYQVLAHIMRPGDGLLTAHHQDDQAETLLIQLLRGAGPKGLAAMAAVREFSCGHILRPLLDYRREELEIYARSAGIQWVDDPSNTDEAFDRNYLRHRILPSLQQRWPALTQTLGRAARHQAEADQLLRELAELDMASHVQDGALSMRALQGLSRIRQKNLLRQWIDSQHYPLPAESRLQSILSDLIPAAEDAAPVVCWNNVELRRYRSSLYLMPALGKHHPESSFLWDGEFTYIADGEMSLDSQHVPAGGLRDSLFTEHKLEIRFRQGGEQCRPAGRGNTKDLKKLLQEAAIAPWLRQRLPLIYVDNELAAVVGVCICEGFAAGEGETGREVMWKWRKKSSDSEK